MRTGISSHPIFKAEGVTTFIPDGEALEESGYTNNQQRIEAAKKGEGNIPEKLMRFQGAAKKHQADGIPCALKDYIELVDATRPAGG